MAPSIFREVAAQQMCAYHPDHQHPHCVAALPDGRPWSLGFSASHRLASPPPPGPRTRAMTMRCTEQLAGNGMNKQYWGKVAVKGEVMMKKAAPRRARRGRSAAKCDGQKRRISETEQRIITEKMVPKKASSGGERWSPPGRQQAKRPRLQYVHLRGHRRVYLSGSSTGGPITAPSRAATAAQRPTPSPLDPRAGRPKKNHTRRGPRSQGSLACCSTTDGRRRPAAT